MLVMYFATGFEEVEAIATLDVIRRANIDIISVGVGSKLVTGAHNITIQCDATESEVLLSKVEGIILPGGMPGTTNLFENEEVIKSLDYCVSNKKLVAAICAAPMILGKKGILKGKNATCFPGFEDELKGAVISEKYVVTDGNVITARGMGSAIHFGLAIVERLSGTEKAEKLSATLQLYK